MTLGDRLLEVALGEKRAVLFTVLAGQHPGARLLVSLDGREAVGDAPAGLAAPAPEVRRTGQREHDGVQIFAELHGPPRACWPLDEPRALPSAQRCLDSAGWHARVAVRRYRGSSRSVPSAALR